MVLLIAVYSKIKIASLIYANHMRPIVSTVSALVIDFTAYPRYLAPHNEYFFGTSPICLCLWSTKCDFDQCKDLTILN